MRSPSIYYLEEGGEQMKKREKKELGALCEQGAKLGALWADNNLPKEVLRGIPPQKWGECASFLGRYPRKNSLLTKWGDTKGWERWMLRVLSVLSIK